MKDKDDDLWIEIDLSSMYVTDITSIENSEPLFYDAKLWHEMVASCFPDKAVEIPLSEDFKSSDDLKFYHYAAEYYSSNITTECISPYDLDQTYKLVIDSDIQEGKFLLNDIPSKDTTYHIGGDSTLTYEYTLAPNLQITITHPTGGQDHYLFEKYEDGTKMTKEREPN